jgi:hypothetical protein
MGFSGTPNPFGGSVSAAPGKGPSRSFSKAYFGDNINKIDKKTQDMIDIDPVGFLNSGAKKNALDQALASGYVDLSVTGIDFDAPFGYVSGLTPEQAASPFNIPAQDRVNIGDKTGLLGRAVRAFATPALALMNPALALPTTVIDAAAGTGLTSFLSDFSFSDINPFGPETSQQISDAAESVAEPITGAVEQAGQAISDAWSGPFAQSLGFHSEPSQFSVQPRNLGPGPIPLQVPPPAVPPLATQPLEPLSDVEVADYTDGGHTIEELMEMGVGAIPPLPPITGVFVNRGGFIDKPLYSRS